MSMVDLMANVRWTDADFTRRTEAMLSTEWPQMRREILDRDLEAVKAGMASPSQALTDERNAFATAAYAARAAGVEGRRDARKLNAALDIEEALAACMSIPGAPAEGEDPHAQARAAAAAHYTALMAAASNEVKALCTARIAHRASVSPAEQDPQPEGEA